MAQPKQNRAAFAMRVGEITASREAVLCIGIDDSDQTRSGGFTTDGASIGMTSSRGLMAITAIAEQIITQADECACPACEHAARKASNMLLILNAADAEPVITTQAEIDEFRERQGSRPRKPH